MDRIDRMEESDSATCRAGVSDDVEGEAEKTLAYSSCFADSRSAGGGSVRFRTMVA